MGSLVSVHLALIAWVAMPPENRGVLPRAASPDRLQVVEVVPAAPPEAPATPRFPRARAPDGAWIPAQPRRASTPDDEVARDRTLESRVDPRAPFRGIDEWARSSGAADDAIPGFRQPRDPAAGAGFERPTARIPGRQEAFVEGIQVRATLSPQDVVNGVGQFLFGRPTPETCTDIRQRLSVYESGAAREIDLDKLRRFCSGTPY